MELTAAISGTAVPIVVSSHQHGFLRRQARAEHQQGAHYKLEVSARKKTPAICFAAKASDPDDNLLVMPSDQWIENTSSFTKTVRRATTISVVGRYVTFSITATEPATGYAYIKVVDRNENMANVVSFTEKPERRIAEQFPAQAANSIIRAS